MITCNEKAKVYVLCPAQFKTGGTELLHQIVFQLNNRKIESYIVYCNPDKKKSIEIPEFKKYINTYLLESEIIDSCENIILVPETLTNKIRCFNNARKIIWWLSVDSFIRTNGFKENIKADGILKAIHHLLKGSVNKNVKISSFNSLVDLNMCQSYYALDFLNSNEVNNIAFLSDYLNDIYLSSEFNTKIKENIVLYNPRKGYEYTKKIIDASPNFKWVPIENMTTSEVHELLEKSKVYVDFGHHPGKDRFPREAAITGNCIITGKLGSAKYHKDVMIDDEFKFEDEEKSIPMIIKKINQCLDNYEIEIMKFHNYRNMILGEKEEFINDVGKIFIKE